MSHYLLVDGGQSGCRVVDVVDDDYGPPPGEVCKRRARRGIEGETSPGASDKTGAAGRLACASRRVSGCRGLVGWFSRSWRRSSLSPL